MLQHDPLKSITFIHDLGLHSSIFPSTLDVPRGVSLQAATILREVSQSFQVDEILWLAAAVSPFRGFSMSGKKTQPAVSILLSEGLKVSAQC